MNDRNKNSFKENFSSLIISFLLLGGIGIIFPIIRSVMPDTPLFNNRTTVVFLANAIVSLSMVVILVMAFTPLKEVIRFYIDNKSSVRNKDLVYKSSISLILFLYTFPIYYLLASRWDTEAGA